MTSRTSLSPSMCMSLSPSMCMSTTTSAAAPVPTAVGGAAGRRAVEEPT
jgi:hypothetical protein